MRQNKHLKKTSFVGSCCWTLTKTDRLHVIRNMIFACVLSVIAFVNPVFSQETASKINIKGKLIDSLTGEPLPFVTILEKGTTNGTQTDLNGEYKLAVENNQSVLVISSIGYKSQEVPVGDQAEINVKLAEDSKVLEEVVVVGYGQQKKRDVTGATVSISDKELKDKPVVGFAEAMQGRLAGVQVVQSSGQPGGGATIRVRGVGTINNSNPLVVIDGFPVQGGLSVIDPNTIERIDVLKDASACAIYGARGANGVILVTTKRGTKGKPQVNFHHYQGTSNVIRLPQLLNGSQYAHFHNEMMTNGKKSLNKDFTDYEKFGEGTNWLNEVFKTARDNYYGLEIGGATEKSRYMISSSYLEKEGTILNSGYNRINTQINNTSDVTDKITFGTTNMIGYEKYIDVNVVKDALNMLPVLPVYNADGTYAGPKSFSTYGDAVNPVGQANEIQKTEDKYRLISNVFVEFKILRDFKFRSAPGIDISYIKKRTWTPLYKWGISQNPIATLWQSRDDDMIGMWDNTLTYDKVFNDHKVTAMIGTGAYHSVNEYQNGQKNNFPNEITQQVNNGITPFSVGGSYNEYALLYGLARVNYSFKDKYLATINFRLDGSSRFGSNYRYGKFPSASAAWRISDENFFTSARKIVNELKLRVGYGFTGNQEIGNYSYSNQIANDLKYSFGNTIVGAAAPISLANPNVHWETTEQFNVGLDVSMLEDRIGFTGDFYIKNTNGMLQQRPIASFIGLPGDKPYVNIGEMRNQGVELGVNGTVINGNIVKKNFKWTSSFNITFNQNKITSLYNGVALYDNNGANLAGVSKTLTTKTEDYPFGEFYGYVTDGIFQNQQEVADHAVQVPGTNPATSTSAGDIRFKDLNGDRVINDKDRTYLGSPFPTYHLGFTNTFSFVGFELSVFFQAVQGNKIFNANRLYNESMSSVKNQYASVLDRWTGEGTSSTMPRAVYADPNGNTRPSDRFIEDGSYIRLKNLTLAYVVPAKWVKKAYLGSFSVYMSCQNLWTKTKYSGFDPEVSTNDTNNGIDLASYPVPRTITFGVKVGL